MRIIKEQKTLIYLNGQIACVLIAPRICYSENKHYERLRQELCNRLLSFQLVAGNAHIDQIRFLGLTYLLLYLATKK